MIDLNAGICSDFSHALSREWLETNGIGGYASGTISGANSRRYHGLLVAATLPPLGRMVLLSKLEETLIIDGEQFEMSCNQFPGVVHPEGYKYLTGFRLDPFPIWTYTISGMEVEKRIFMVDGENTTVISWTVKTPDAPAIELEVRPLLAFRDYHHLQHRDPSFDVNYTVGDGLISFAPYPDLPTLGLAHSAANFSETGYWYDNFQYAVELERGFDYAEDLYQPCSLTFDLSAPAVVTASTESRLSGSSAKFEADEMGRRAALISVANAANRFRSQLSLAADQFIVDRGKGKTVIAGYHWFSDWGRDTMISLPGLTLATDRPEIARSILAEFSLYLSQGTLPNRFPDAGEQPEYNTVDATLWFFEAIRAYVEATGDHAFVREDLYDKLVDVIDWHVRGTRYRIHVDTDGLLYAGEPGVQLTWMDAKIGNWVVTARTGKPVEIQALWYNALCIMAKFAEEFDDDDRSAKYQRMAATAKASFRGQFWNAEEQCLYDVIDGADRDASVRPNQIFAVSLPYQIAAPEHARAIVDKVEAELLTPFGLRSLSPADPRYVPVYIGSPEKRDSSYHQGTVWGWLIGPFIDAYRKTHSRDARADERVTAIIAGFEARLTTAMLGQIGEIFDGAAPNLPRGCAAQAWSVAELLRVSRSAAGTDL